MAQTNLSKLQENFTCLAIVCVDLIKLPLIDILDNHIKPSDLYAEINSTTLKSGNDLRSDQKKICYITPPGIPDYSKFDVSLLYTLIRNLCPSLKPTGRWGEEPAAAHTQLGDDIERLRLFRNREFAHATSAQTPDSEFKNHWTYIQTVINRIQSNKKAGCKTDYGQSLKNIEKRLLNCDDLEKYKLLLEATIHISKQRGDMDGPDIWIEGPVRVVCGSTAHFQATVKEKKVSCLSVTWQKISKNDIKQIDISNKTFWGKTNKELSIESVCKEDEGKYQAVLSIEEDRIKTSIQSNVIFMHVVGGIPDLTTSHETCLQTQSVKLIGNVSIVDDLPVIDEIYWSKDGNEIDTHGNEGKYSKVSVDVPSLTIYNVNQYDAGHYTLTATNAAGTTVSDAIVLGAPNIVLDESKEESDGSQIFTVTITSIPAAYNIQWLVSDNNSDMFTNLDENAEEYKGTSHSVPHPVLVVRQKEQLKNKIYQIEVQNFIGGRRKKIPSILNIFYKDRGAGAMFAKLSNDLAKMFPERKLDRLQALILDSCQDKDKELSPLIKNAKSAREYFSILKKKDLFTPSDVIFMQFLLRESNCGILNEKCIKYAKTQKALCFYEEPPRNGYKKVKFHIQGDISNYTADQIEIIKETVAAAVGCKNEEIHLNGFCKSTSFFVVLSIKERCINGLFNMKQQDKEKLTSLNINYFIVDSDHVYLEHPKAKETEESNEKRSQKISGLKSFIRPNKTKHNPETPVSKFPSNIIDECETVRGKIAASTTAVIVAAIDIGTTFSGCAFAKRYDFENDESKIHISTWKDQNGLMSYKTLSTVLLDQKGKITKFGFEAELKYLNMLLDGIHKYYYYFRNLKMMLNDQAKTKKTLESMVLYTRERELPAVNVIASVIKYLKDQLLDDLKKMGFGSLESNKINWVLTVPAVLDDNAKMFMREAAQKAGLPSGQFIIASESDAASVYCKHLPDEILEGANSRSLVQHGSKYLVIDAGGRSVDITLSEVKLNGHIAELDRSSCGHWGGSCVDKAFKSTLAEIVTEEMIKKYKHKHLADYMCLFNVFERRKFNYQRDTSVIVRFPMSLYMECLEMFGEDLKTLINKSKFKDQIKVMADRFKINWELFETFFQPACDGIIKHVKQLFQSPKFKDVNKIFMVGGFSESYILQDAIRDAFPNCQVRVPKEPSLAVLRGAVMLGNDLQSIASRIA